MDEPVGTNAEELHVCSAVGIMIIGTALPLTQKAGRMLAETAPKGELLSMHTTSQQRCSTTQTRSRH